MTRTVFQLRCTDTELARWREAADGNLSRFIREAIEAHLISEAPPAEGLVSFVTTNAPAAYSTFKPDPKHAR